MVQANRPHIDRSVWCVCVENDSLLADF